MNSFVPLYTKDINNMGLEYIIDVVTETQLTSACFIRTISVSVVYQPEWAE